MDFYNVRKFHNILSFLRYNLKMRLTSQSGSMSTQKEPSSIRSHSNYCKCPAAATAMSVVLKVLPDILDVGIVLKHGAGLAVYASV